MNQPIAVEVSSTLARLLAQEDTDGDTSITVLDRGPKAFELQGVDGLATTVYGTYALSNLLQELALADGVISIDPGALREAPPARISSAISERYWNDLTRRIDEPDFERVLADPKGDGALRLYLPKDDTVSWTYYREFVGRHNFELLTLPWPLGAGEALNLNRVPGLLGLAFDESGRPAPYVVPGGRFNECYGWDSYFITLGLVRDQKWGLAKSMADHMVHQVEWYGAILNANRTYYLTRSQPPFLTSMLRLLAAKVDDRRWLERALRAASREYQEVWMGPDRLLPGGLSRYFCRGLGYPPETLPRHYPQVMAPFARGCGMSDDEFRRAYLERRVTPPELDAYFREDRAVRESGHDTSYRLEGQCTRLATVDLNSLLYRYERDMADLLEGWFSGRLEGLPTATQWRERAARRQQLMSSLCWREDGFFDYDVERGAPTGYLSATNLYPLWAGLASDEQARALVDRVIPRLSEPGGIAGGTEDSRGPVGPDRTPRQWDFPYGWAPHQILLWKGLENYGYHDLAAELAARWVRMLTQCAVDFNGVLAEKYDLVARSHEVFAEYANQGTEVRYVPREGFGWTNASYQLGLDLLGLSARRELDGLQASDQNRSS